MKRTLTFNPIFEPVRGGYQVVNVYELPEFGTVCDEDMYREFEWDVFTRVMEADDMRERGER